jgi:hypothetical protein
MPPTLLILGVSLAAGPGAAQQPSGPRIPVAGFGSLSVKPEVPDPSRVAGTAVARDPADLNSRLSLAREAGRRRSPWLLPVVGAVAGGALMSGYRSHVCRDEECNLSPVPFVAGAVGLGGLLGWMIDRSL